MMRMRFPLLLAILFVARPSSADEVTPAKKSADAGSPDSALKSFSVASGLQVEVWASEPLLANPVAFTFDDAGRAYVAETYRRRSSALDIRKYEDWHVPNLALRSVEDRVAFIKAKFPESAKLPPTNAWPDLNKDGQFDWRDLEVESEQVRVIEDSDGDGKADKARVLAAGFNSVATTVGAGVVADGKGGVFYTCIPDLWHIAADGTKTKLLTGFGVHIVYSGHEMHGARMGPDGRLYFSIADCGAHVVSKEGKTIAIPDSGAIFRCWPDGSELELFAKGLRNPQHLVFNDLGDLFTADNNADGGDKARWIHVVQGGDYGWRIGWQFLPKLGAWNSEGMWHLDVGKTNPAILPAVAHIGHGPAGIAYYPGTGLPEKFRGHFFYADFPGGIRHFAMKPKGATYEMADFAPDALVLQDNKPGEMTAKLLWNLNPSDVQFAPGGGVMVLDWTPGWEKSGKGRIFRVFSPEMDTDPLAVETKQLLRDGFARRTVKELGALLSHADQRVRVGAQFALVDRIKSTESDAAVATLKERAAKDESLFARLHAIWGLGMAGRERLELLEPVLALLADANEEVRAQATKVCANATKLDDPRRAAFANRLSDLLRDPSTRVRFFAFEGACRLDLDQEKLLGAANRETPDAMIRHAFARAFAVAIDRRSRTIGQPPPIGDSKVDTSILIDALRKVRRPVLGRLLAFKNAQPNLEVARAIHDEPIPAAMPALVDWLEKIPTSRGDQPTPVAPWEASMDQTVRRAINAAYRLGDARAAKVLASVASAPPRSYLPAHIQIDALNALTNWTYPLGRDRVLGILVEGDGQRVSADAVAALEPVAPTLLAAENHLVRIAALEAFAVLKIRSVEPALVKVVGSPGDATYRAIALRALAALESPNLSDALRAALNSKDALLSAEARRLSSKLGGAAGVATNAAVLGKGSIAEQQEALATLGKINGAEADQIFIQQLDLLLGGKLPPALHLDLLEAAGTRSGEAIQSRVAAYEKSRNPVEPLSRWKETLEGGDPKLGRVIFAEKAEAGCMRCHAVKKQGGDVGPDLGGIAANRDRAFLLRAIVDPNAEIAQGYENVLLTLANGEVVAGLLNKEDAVSVTLKNPADGKPQVVKKAGITERQGLPSAMPPALGEVLGKRGLRDLVAYLATLKEP
jgi:quinoprotein glucose dehydrogenase